MPNPDRAQERRHRPPLHNLYHGDKKWKPSAEMYDIWIAMRVLRLRQKAPACSVDLTPEPIMGYDS